MRSGAPRRSYSRVVRSNVHVESFVWIDLTSLCRLGLLVLVQCMQGRLDQELVSSSWFRNARCCLCTTTNLHTLRVSTWINMERKTLDCDVVAPYSSTKRDTEL